MTRARRTRAEIEAFDDAVRDIAERVQPATARQVYYRSVVAGLVEKDHRGYRWVVESLVRQRWSGAVPWSWIADETRAVRAPETWADADRGLAAFARAYRRDAWRDQPAWVEVWVESDSLAGTLIAETWRLGVPLYSGRGFSSLTALRDAAEATAERWQERDQGTAILYCGDLDPSGWEASRAAERGLARHLAELGSADAADVLAFRRLAVNPEDVHVYNLPTGAKPKAGKKHRGPGRHHGPGSTSWFAEGGPGLPFTVEAEAFEPEVLRDLVRGAILEHADLDALRRAWRVEELERETLALVAQRGLTVLGRSGNEESPS